MISSEDAFTALQATYPPLADTAPLLVAIEDDPAAQLNLRLTALAAGCAIDVIGDLADADAQLLPRLHDELPRRPVLLLVDQQLPFQGVMTNIDGWAIMGQVMQAMLDRTLPPVLMVALSADMTEERRTHAMASGAYVALEKPFTDADLIELMALAADPQVAARLVDQHRTAGEAQQVMARSVGRRMLDGLKAMAGATLKQDTITPEAMLILLFPLHRDRAATIQHFGTTRSVLHRLDQAIAQVRNAAPDPDVVGAIIQSMQEGWSQQQLCATLHMGRTTVYHHRQAVLQALCTAFLAKP